MLGAMSAPASTQRLELTVVDAEGAARSVAGEIATLVRDRQDSGRAAVLGLATGSTPVGVYRELVRLHREEGLSFSNVITFNLDEYLGLPASHPFSFRRFMAEQLFDHVDIDADNVHLPEGDLHEAQIEAHCRDYELRIRDVGGIDLQLLGLGLNGHIGFNEPGSEVDSRTRATELHSVTRESAARWFGSLQDVPTQAITMGVATILEARRVRVLALGERKRRVVSKLMQSEATSELPASFLHGHADVRVFADRDAAGTAQS